METDLETETETTSESPVIKELRKKADKADRLDAEMAKLQQENVILKAGLSSLSEKQLKALMAAHEGDLTAETVKATAAELGFVSTSKADQEQESKGASPGELAAQARVTDATSSGISSPKVDWNARLAEAKTQDEAMAVIREATAAGKMVSHHGV